MAVMLTLQQSTKTTSTQVGFPTESQMQDQIPLSWTSSLLGQLHKRPMNPIMDTIVAGDPIKDQQTPPLTFTLSWTPITIGLIHHGWVDPIKD